MGYQWYGAGRCCCRGKSLHRQQFYQRGALHRRRSPPFHFNGRTCAAGWIGGKRIALTDITLDISTPNGTVAVQSIDENPIKNSNKILISLSEISLPSRQNKLPFHCSPFRGTLSVRARPGLHLYQASALGPPLQIPVTSENDAYLLKLSSASCSHFLILK